MQDTLKNTINFTNPPLHEVVLDVQFDALKNFSGIERYGLFELFKADYPTYKEAPEIFPSFEIPGQSNDFLHSIHLNMPTNIRVQFWNKDETALIQFQNGRFIQNWRKTDNNAYPRFSEISKIFLHNFQSAQKYLEKSGTISINQAEISYQNKIPINREKEKLSDWVTGISDTDNEADFYVKQTIKALRNEANELCGNLKIQLQYLPNEDHIAIGLTARGRPQTNNIAGGVSFMEMTRLKLAESFVAVTTDHAHQEWGYNKNE